MYDYRSFITKKAAYLKGNIQYIRLKSAGNSLDALNNFMIPSAREQNTYFTRLNKFLTNPD